MRSVSRDVAFTGYGAREPVKDFLRGIPDEENHKTIGIASDPVDLDFCFYVRLRNGCAEKFSAEFTDWTELWT